VPNFTSIMSSYLNRVAKGTCPNCEKTKVFASNGNPFLFKMPKMKKQCDVCGYSFHRETGFYFGAMYISYGITCAEMIAVIVLGLIFDWSFITIFSIVIVIAFLFSMINYKLSRLMWLNIFLDKDGD